MLLLLGNDIVRWIDKFKRIFAQAQMQAIYVSQYHVRHNICTPINHNYF